MLTDGARSGWCDHPLTLSSHNYLLGTLFPLSIHTCNNCGLVFNPSPLQALQDHVMFATFPPILVSNHIRTQFISCLGP